MDYSYSRQTESHELARCVGNIPNHQVDQASRTVWGFCRKYDADGNPVKLKARLCAQGNAQEEGVKFTNTYPPTGRAAALRAVLTFGLQEGMDVHQMDVKNVFSK